HAAALTRADADFEDEDFGGELVSFLQIVQHGPELAYAVLDGLFVIAVRLASGEGLLVPFACGLFPIAQVAPVEAVELPGDAVAEGFEVFKRDPVIGRAGIGGLDGAQHRSAQRIRRDLARIDPYVDHRW